MQIFSSDFCLQQHIKSIQIQILAFISLFTCVYMAHYYSTLYYNVITNKDFLSHNQVRTTLTILHVISWNNLRAKQRAKTHFKRYIIHFVVCVYLSMSLSVPNDTFVRVVICFSVYWTLLFLYKFSFVNIADVIQRNHTAW